MHAQDGGGPLAHMLEYKFHSDGTYEMSGYPPIRENGRFSVQSRDKDSFTLRLTDRRGCGPCSPQNPMETRKDLAAAATLTANGRTLTFQGLTLTRSK